MVLHMRDAQAVEYQRRHSWPPEGTPGIVTITGRLFHRGEDCPGYRRGVEEARKHGREVAPVDRVTAVTARARGKGACSQCWPQG